MPVVTMIAGPNGSGKSTLTNELTRLGIEFGKYLNADEIARELTGSPASVAAKAQAELRARRIKAMNEGRDHCFETVMSHPSHIEYLLSAKATGFEIRLYFVATDDPEINRGRVANRVLHGGHDVPADRIASRYHRCLTNLPSAIAAADYTLLLDNTSIEQPMRPIAEISNSKIWQYEVLDQDPLDFPNWWLVTKPLLELPELSRYHHLVVR